MHSEMGTFAIATTTTATTATALVATENALEPIAKFAALCKPRRVNLSVPRVAFNSAAVIDDVILSIAKLEVCWDT